MTLADALVYAWPILLIVGLALALIAHLLRYSAHLAEGDRRRAAKDAAWDRAYRAQREAGEGWR